MKKVKLTGKLSLNKQSISKLNDDQMTSLQGGVCTNGGSGCSGAGRPCASIRCVVTGGTCNYCNHQ
jgi:natural product precursor